MICESQCIVIPLLLWKATGGWPFTDGIKFSQNLNDWGVLAVYSEIVTWSGLIFLVGVMFWGVRARNPWNVLPRCFPGLFGAYVLKTLVEPGTDRSNV